MEGTQKETIENLKQDGYLEQFSLATDCIECWQGTFQLFHDEFQIDQYFRLDGMENQSIEMIVYAIQSEKFQMKGILIQPNGIFPEHITNEMKQKLIIQS